MSCSCLLAFLFYSGRQLCSLLYSQLLFLSYFIWATWGFLFCINTGIRNESRMNQGSLSATADLLLILATFTVSLAYFSVCFYCFFMQKCKNILHVWNVTETETLPLQLPVFGREHENKTFTHVIGESIFFLVFYLRPFILILLASSSSDDRGRDCALYGGPESMESESIKT